MSILLVPGDFETRSPLELPDVGVARYAEHPQTDVWCLAYSLTDDPADVRLWTRDDLLPPLELFDALERGYFRAWNAAFEETIWREIMVKRYGWPVIAPDRFICAMAMAAAAALPLSLDKAAIALRLQEQKDMVGHKLMKKMAKPRQFKKKEVRPPGPGPFWCDHDPANLPRLGAYCRQDVRTEIAAWRAMPPAMNQRERALWLMDQRINRRGIAIDLPLIRAAQSLIDVVKPQLDARVADLTDGLKVTQVEKLKSWLSDQGVATASLDKESIGDLLAVETISEDVRTVLIARQEGAKASTAKYATMLGAVCADGRVRGTMQYFGATTGRWAGRGVQPHNMPKPSRKITTAILDDIRGADLPWIEALYGPVLPLLSDALRTCFIAGPETLLAVADYSTIEARVVAWLAGQDDLTEAFANNAKVYEEFAASIHEVLIDVLLQHKRDTGEHHPWRQDGKVGILGCGFGMGPDRMHEQYGIPLSLCKKIVKLYRQKYTAIVDLWTNMNNAANEAVLGKCSVDVPDTFGRLRFEAKGGYLLLHLPSGRPLWYHAPTVRTYTVVRWEEVEDPLTGEIEIVDKSFEATGVECSVLHPLTKQWVRQQFYGGIWTENAVQACARDVMADAMLRCEAKGVDVVLSVHDEIVAEVQPETRVQDFVDLLTVLPEWAAGCPIAAEGYIEERYRK